jgi:hypothetical protein
VNVPIPYRVRVIVDPAFGERLLSLPADAPIWIIASPSNTSVVQRLWRERPEVSHLMGVTTFAPNSGATSEDELISQLETIDLHHGHYSADPPYSILEVIGCPCSERVQSALREIGFAVDTIGPDGFTAIAVPTDSH